MNDTRESISEPCSKPQKKHISEFLNTKVFCTSEENFQVVYYVPLKKGFYLYTEREHLICLSWFGLEIL